MTPAQVESVYVKLVEMQPEIRIEEATKVIIADLAIHMGAPKAARVVGDWLVARAQWRTVIPDSPPDNAEGFEVGDIGYDV